jgi:3',5'-cyclic AMP phosphodiesterase CpdA
MMLIAQLSDTHILAEGKLYRTRGGFGPIDTGAFLSRAVETLNALDPLPDLTVVTGDLADHGAAEEYAHLRTLLAPLRMPVFLIPGNHDTRDALRAAFGATGYLPREGFLQYTIEEYPLRLVALDTLVPGVHSGGLCAERLRWLDEALAGSPERPTLVLMHHPPFRTGIEHMDEYGLDNAAGFAEVILRHPQVERILCGHLHRAIDRRFAGTVAGTAPSTAHQIVFNIRPKAPLSFLLEPPGYQLHLWQDGAGLVTHNAVIGDWAATAARVGPGG